MPDSDIELDIVIFLLPWEIPAYEKTVQALKSCLRGTSDPPVSLHVCLGLSSEIVDWNQSLMDRGIVIEAFDRINDSIDWTREKRMLVDTGNDFRGCVDWRRHHLRRDPGKIVIWLDPDVVFPVSAFSAIRHLLIDIPDQYFITVPQIPRMWDDSWDCLVHESCANEPLGQCYGFDTARVHGCPPAASDVRLETSPEFKFGGGWLTVFSVDLLRLIGIPDSFKSYGQEDSFIMKVCEQLKQQGWPITQYIMYGILVAHDYELSQCTRHLYRTVNDKSKDAAFNRSIRDHEVATSVSRIQRLRIN